MPISDAEFVERVERIVAANEMRVEDTWRAELGGEAGLERIAALCETPYGSVHRLVQSGDRWWHVRLDSGWAPHVCEASKPQKAMPRKTNDQTLHIKDYGAEWDAAFWFAIREGELVLVRESTSTHSTMSMSSDGRDFDTRMRRGSYLDGEVSWRTQRREGALVAVADGAAHAQESWNEALFGREVWSGPADASLRVGAGRTPSGAIEIAIAVTDDAPVPLDAAADDAAFIAADHVELWWYRSDGDRCYLKREKGPCSHQLGFAEREDGSIDVRWLVPGSPTLPLPSVEHRDGGFVVVLPETTLSGRAPFTAVPFTAVWSDSDARGTGQETLVATSRLAWGNPATFGELTLAWGRGGLPSWQVRPVAASDRLELNR